MEAAHITILDLEGDVSIRIPDVVFLHSPRFQVPVEDAVTEQGLAEVLLQKRTRVRPRAATSARADTV